MVENFYNLTLEETYQKFHTDPKIGIDVQQAEIRLEEYGFK